MKWCISVIAKRTSRLLVLAITVLMSLVHTIDLHFQGKSQLIAAYLVECGAGQLALVEPGPGSTLPAIQQGIQRLGFNTKDVQHVFVTHVHLDHAGAAGWWAQQGAKVYAHPRTVPHLLDPSKLMESARLVYGDRLETLWGEMLPAPEAQVVTLQDGDSVLIGECTFKAHDTPGHARHHHAYSIGDVCFTGDTAGARLPEQAYISVTSAPPQFDPVAYCDSITKLEKEAFSKLYLAHFGEVTDVASHWQLYRQRINEVHHTVRQFIDHGLEGDALQAAYESHEKTQAQQMNVSADTWDSYQCANNTSMCSDGIALYCRKNPA